MVALFEWRKTMGRNMRAKKKTPDDKKKKFYISQKELEKMIVDAKQEATSDAFIIMLAAVRDCKGLDVEEVYELADTVLRYSWYDENNITKNIDDKVLFVAKLKFQHSKRNNHEYHAGDSAKSFCESYQCIQSSHAGFLLGIEQLRIRLFIFSVLCFLYYAFYFCLPVHIEIELVQLCRSNPLIL